MVQVIAYSKCVENCTWWYNTDIHAINRKLTLVFEFQHITLQMTARTINRQNKTRINSKNILAKVMENLVTGP